MPKLRSPPVTTLASETIHLKKQDPPRLNGIWSANKELREACPTVRVRDFLNGLTVWGTSCQKDVDQVVIPLRHLRHWPDRTGTLATGALR